MGNGRTFPELPAMLDKASSPFILGDHHIENKIAATPEGRMFTDSFPESSSVVGVLTRYYNEPTASSFTSLASHHGRFIQSAARLLTSDLRGLSEKLGWKPDRADVPTAFHVLGDCPVTPTAQLAQSFAINWFEKSILKPAHAIKHERADVKSVKTRIKT
jgi:hypothetical protein